MLLKRYFKNPLSAGIFALFFALFAAAAHAQSAAEPASENQAQAPAGLAPVPHPPSEDSIDQQAEEDAAKEEAAAAPIHREPAVTIDSIAAVVNNDVITVNELRERISLIDAQLRKQNVNPPPPEVLQKQVLEHMIIESAQLQMAKEMGLRIDDTHLDRTLARIAESQHLTLQQYQQKVESDGTPWEKHREKVRNDITIQRLRDREVNNKVQINDAEVDNLVGSGSPAQQAQEEFRLAHILIRIPENASPEEIKEKRARADKVLKMLKAGEDFHQKAATYSDADEGLQGGDIGWKSPNQLPKVFVEALSGLQPGQITGLIKSPNGFHILKILEKRSVSAKNDEQQAEKTPGPKPDGSHIVQQIHARHILIKINQLVSADDAKRKLTDLKQRILNNSATFEELAKTFSNDTSASRGGDLGWIYPGDTVPEFEKALVALQPGELSDPVETQFGFHLIQVLEKKTDDMSLERKRQAAKQALRERKIAEGTEEWFRQIRDQAYVEYRLNKQEP